MIEKIPLSKSRREELPPKTEENQPLNAMSDWKTRIK